MENFDERNQTRLKEKNVYLLHLDTPRILIISSVLIGLLIISFLFGINMKKDKETDNILSKKDPLLDLALSDKDKDDTLLINPETNPLTKRNIDLNSPLTDDINQKDPVNEITNIDPLKTHNKEKNDNPVSSDILTKDDIKEIIPPAKEVSKTLKKKDKDIKKKKAKKQIKKKEVVEVASDANNNFKKKNFNGKGFSIQVASHDKKSKALSEVKKLRRLKYDAFIDNVTVSGRKYYRVRIGPIASKKKALRTLNEIQGQNRYEESYMIKE